MKATKFGEIMQNNGHYNHTLFKVTDFGASRRLVRDFLFVIASCLAPFTSYG